MLFKGILFLGKDDVVTVNFSGIVLTQVTNCLDVCFVCEEQMRYDHMASGKL